MTKFRYAALCAAALTTLAVAPAHATPAHAAPAPTQTLAEFYAQTVPNAAQLENGHVVDRRPVDLGIAGLLLTTERIIYKTTNTHGDATLVSGFIMTPTVPWTPKPGVNQRPVVAFAPGTTGMADRCASSVGLESSGAPALIPLLTDGYSVVATDYVGLGTPGGHTYLNRLDAGHAVLDAARAGVGNTGAPVLLYGYSEGGHSVGAAAELAASYGEGLDVKGSFMGAPPADPSLNVENLDNTELAPVMMYAMGGLVNAYPEHAAAMKAVLNEQGKAEFDTAQNSCATDPGLKSWTDSSTLSVDGRPLGAHMNEAPFADLVKQNTVGYGVPSAPVLLAHANFDEVVPFEQSTKLMERWAKDDRFTDVELVEYKCETLLCQLPSWFPLGTSHAPAGFMSMDKVRKFFMIQLGIPVPPFLN